MDKNRLRQKDTMVGDVAELEPFNPAHPPKMRNPECRPASTSKSEQIGEYDLTSEDFEHVGDILYPWRDMPRVTPAQNARYQAVRQKQKAEVSCYRLRRERFWKQIGYSIHNVDTTITLTTTEGMEWTHEEESGEDITKELGITLNLDLAGNIMSPEPPVPPVATLKTEEATPCAGAKFGSSLELTARLSHTLRFSTRDSRTYRKERSISIQKEFKAGIIYIDWQIVESLSLLRVRNGKEELMKTLEAGTEVLCGDFLATMPPEPQVEQPRTTSDTTLTPGGTVVYSTRPVGLKTHLYARPAKMDEEGSLSYHVELCCQETHSVIIDPSDPNTGGLVIIDLSSAEGALVTVANTGWSSIVVHTDY